MKRDPDFNPADYERWFYDFQLPDGRSTNPELSPELREIHRDRLAMLEEAVNVAFPQGLNGCAAIDVGCHEGFFLHQLRALGAGHLTGVDLRPGNIAKAERIALELGIDRVRWLCSDAEDLRQRLGPDSPARPFELALAYGLIYHCENPIRVLRQIASVTNRAIVIETQLLDDRPPEAVEWGRAGYQLETQGMFALVDEGRLFASNRETGASPLALCPSESAVRTVLKHLGFTRFQKIEARSDSTEQLARGKRAVFVAVREEVG